MKWFSILVLLSLFVLGCSDRFNFTGGQQISIIYGVFSPDFHESIVGQSHSFGVGGEEDFGELQVFTDGKLWHTTNRGGSLAAVVYPNFEPEIVELKGNSNREVYFGYIWHDLMNGNGVLLHKEIIPAGEVDVRLNVQDIYKVYKEIASGFSIL